MFAFFNSPLFYFLEKKDKVTCIQTHTRTGESPASFSLVLKDKKMSVHTAPEEKKKERVDDNCLVSMTTSTRSEKRQIKIRPGFCSFVSFERRHSASMSKSRKAVFRRFVIFILHDSSGPKKRFSRRRRGKEPKRKENHLPAGGPFLGESRVLPSSAMSSSATRTA